jgi:predicted Zn-dependent protease
MKTVVIAVAVMLAASHAHAQFGGIDRIAKRAQQAKNLADMNISDKDERAIGEQVSTMLVDRFGVYQDPAVAKYVTLVGTVLAQASTRPGLDWKFIVLDTDGVNAYAAPGGLIHITRGALGLIKSEAELAGVLGHEIIHVTVKHTVRAIQKSKGIQVAADQAGASGGLAGAVIGQVANMSYDMVFNNKLDRDDENESDRSGVQLANKVGYSPAGLGEFLTHLAERNKGMKEPNGLFASHPQMNDRQQRLARTIKEDKLTATATVQPRYASVIKFDAKPVAEIAALDVEGAKGVAGGGSASTSDAKAAEAKKEEEKKAEPKKRGFGVGNITSALSGGKQAESTQASASAGGRMGVPDTNATGGANKTPVAVKITPNDIAEFKKGIA